MLTHRRPLLFGLCLLIVASCSTNTDIVDSYVHPDLQGRDLEGVLVVGVTQQQKARVRFEDDFARALRRFNVRAQASHNLVPLEQPTQDQILTAAERANLDTLLVIRYLEASSDDVSARGRIFYDINPAYGLPYHARFGTYYPHVWEIAFQQPVWTSAILHTLVADLYVAATGEHLWQAVSATLQAGSNEETREDAIKDLIRSLKQQGLLR
ncbi:MAG: hypothetical protein HRT77_13725 [Halioglobus sp.]|nr:hypothetical protein [Halioglobus sp.]